MMTQAPPSSLAILERLEKATNAHDLDAIVACFAPDYQSDFPAHPDRAFHGHAQIRRNWSQIFAAVPDIRVSILRATVDEAAIWAEWDQRGTRVDGQPFAMAGVTIFGIVAGQIAWARLYLEPVQMQGSGSDAAIRDVTIGPSAIEARRTP